ncbi:olfactory receptor 6F1-like [Aphelocoma coerulescens]|uniref:olfactory receptor 6F1-like n=1 Tax=Aphelocoma coerulescens TaxID=39617 RepID=UPI003604B873
MGNLCITVFVSTHHQLHHPMYYFLCSFAFLEIWFTTACIPKTLANLVSMYFVFSFGCTEYFFLAAMAYDRYLAVYYPLSYSTIMTSTLSRGLAVGSLGGLSFCGSNIVNYFFCDISPWITLSCTDITLVELVCFVLFAIVILSSCVITLISYISIISTLLRIPSAQGWRRSSSTCSSHLIVVIIWYCSTIFLHVKPSIKASLELKGMRKRCLYKQTVGLMVDKARY